MILNGGTGYSSDLKHRAHVIQSDRLRCDVINELREVLIR